MHPLDKKNIGIQALSVNRKILIHELLGYIENYH